MRGQLTKGECHRSALRYAYRTEFFRGHRAAYQRARSMGWLDEVCSHMVRLIAPNGQWTKDRCAEEALGYRTKSEFRRAKSGCYTVAYSRGWLDEICSHMETQTNSSNRFVYAIASESRRVAYVGLSWNVDQRMRGHRRSRRPEIRRLLSSDHAVRVLSGPHCASVAGRAEQSAIDEFIAIGWNVLNAKKAGALGGARTKWTKERCMLEAARYSTRSSFMAWSPVAYQKCAERGWLDDLCAHQTLQTLPAGHWTIERCREAAQQCKSRRDFRSRFPVARQIAQRRGWLDDICQHMTVEKRGNSYWTKDRCLAEARRFTRPIDFIRSSPGAYGAVRRNSWRAEVYAAIGSSTRG